VPPPLGQQLRELIGTYTNDRQRVWDPYSRYFFQDPVASSLWWLQLSLRLARSWRQLGH
jgi:hypothetical protein